MPNNRKSQRKSRGNGDKRNSSNPVKRPKTKFIKSITRKTKTSGTTTTFRPNKQPPRAPAMKTTSTYKIAHINVNGWDISTHFSLSEILTRENLDILCLSETHLRNEESNIDAEIDGYSLYRCDRSGDSKAGGGMMIYTKTQFSTILPCQHCKDFKFAASNWKTYLILNFW